MQVLGSILGLMLVLPFTLDAQDQITNPERLRWFTDSTVGPINMGVGAVSAGWGTWMKSPEEYGTHWAGFGKRYAVGLSGVATGNAIEAGLGIATREDPRYFPSGTGSTGRRIRRAATLTFMAYHSDGSLAPAYARYVGIAGNNFLTNAWRPPSESNVSSALIRTGLGFASRFVSNLFDEFRNDFMSPKKESR